MKQNTFLEALRDTRTAEPEAAAEALISKLIPDQEAAAFILCDALQKASAEVGPEKWAEWQELEKTIFAIRYAATRGAAAMFGVIQAAVIEEEIEAEVKARCNY